MCEQARDEVFGVVRVLGSLTRVGGVHRVCRMLTSECRMLTSVRIAPACPEAPSLEEKMESCESVPAGVAGASDQEGHRGDAGLSVSVGGDHRGGAEAGYRDG
jgi:hypothetical protein